MTPESRVLITGAFGTVGRTLERSLREGGYDRNLLLPRRPDLDLEDRARTRAWFERERPSFVIHLAAHVGGIAANVADPVTFLAANARIGLNVLESAHAVGVEKTLLLGSSCAYPRNCAQPMREEDILTGALEPTNEGYALAKIMTARLGQYYARAHGMKIVNPVASNVYGPGDHFDLARSHVLSALVKRFVDAKRARAPSLTLWGTGSARREFIHVDDLARAIVFFMERVETPDFVNVGPGTDVSIRELAGTIRTKVGYEGEIRWDSSKPDGMPRKCMDVNKLNALGFQTKVPLDRGIDDVIRDYEGATS